MPERPADIVFGDDGLVPVVVQDRRTADVLMVAWADGDAVDATAETGEAHFWSRSRGEPWHKGATSGNTLAVREIRADCDRDTLLYVVDPAGPACHTGERTCFGAPDRQGFAWLEHLDALVVDRLRHRPDESYTVALAAMGPDGPARKVIEEAAEVAFAAKDHDAGLADDARVAEEAADLLYHLVVLLGERGIPAARVIDVLTDRFEDR
ncbi:MAG: bifunctional phosphoribosyl-AMP cyclohydrolase/phosphoribosyl-ATP diphosphatase HisIE [Acidimicrobiia bacterium]|nr:bifunctional phosphoribosyl-AMP cyclohydrolase/phosphoribosyl-ATP diphosphatase HisIE [Acidimicrobiia bacterium]